VQLDTYVHQVQDQLVAAAALGDDRVREVAATLASAASPAVRLALLSALSALADEITAALLDTADAPAVSVRLDSDEIRVAVTATAAEAAEPPRADDGDVSARISLRLSEALKTEIDDAATRTGISVNTWLVRAATAALNSPSGPRGGPFGGRDHRPGNTQRITGWINS
jgi:predicted HicB family RNase H-like nuclease